MLDKTTGEFLDSSKANWESVVEAYIATLDPSQ